MNSDTGGHPVLYDINTQLKILETLTELKTLVSQALACTSDHETRIRKLEKAVWLAAGGGVAGGGVTGALLSYITGV